MLAKTKLAKLEKQLEVVNARTRNVGIDDAISAIKIAEEKVKGLNPIFRDVVIFVYQPHSVAGAYKYRAMGSSVIVRFNKAGKAIEASAKRVEVGREAKVQLVLDYQKLGEKIEGLSPMEVTELVARVAGFNNFGHINF